MAKKGGERRLLFDTRGRRRHVIRVVYAILAILMGTSLFLVIGPVNIGELIGESSSSGSAAEVFHEQAERVEKRLATDPDDADQLQVLTRARINAANVQLEPVRTGEAATIEPEARQDFRAASESWSRYLKAVEGEPSASLAQLVAASFFGAVELAETLPELEEGIGNSVEAQRIAAEQRPSVGTLSTLALYQYVAGDFAAGDKTTKRAEAEAGTKAEAKSIEKQLSEYRKKAVQFDKQRKQIVKAERKSGKESLQSPFSGFGGG
jgi:hypothetical protein